MLQFDAAASKTDGMQRAVEGNAAVVHSNIDVIAVGIQLHAQIRRG